LLPGLEVKSDGAQVVVPPSLHISGERYRWSQINPIALAPERLLALICEPAPAAVEASDQAQTSPAVRAGSAVIAEGTRNNRAFRYACALRGGGADEVAIRDALERSAGMYSPPLPPSEIEKLARHVARRYPAGGAK
jgi:putative DNA primase/helicase